MTTLYYSFEPHKSEEFIKSVLKKFTGEDREFKILYTENRKPYVEKNIYFSLSHTSGLTVCAVSTGEVGADAEKVRGMKNKEKIIMRFIGKKAEENISDKNFFAEWTRFESLVKYNGGTIVNPGEIPDGSVNIIITELNGYIVSVCCEDKFIEKEQIK